MYVLFVIAKSLCLFLPRHLCYRIAKILAYLHYFTSKKDREAVSYNLKPILGGRFRFGKEVRMVFVNFSYYLVDFFRYSKLDEKFIKKYVTVEGKDNLEKALSQKRGIIALTAHLGNYELGGAVVAVLKYPIYAVALPHKTKHLNDFFNHQRQMVGIQVIPTGLAVKRCFSVLKNGQILALLGDRDFTGPGLKSIVNGHEAMLPRGAAFFALKTGAFIIPSFFVRENTYFYRLIFEEPIDCRGLAEEDILKQYGGILFKYLKRYPEQWYMFQKYWIK